MAVDSTQAAALRLRQAAASGIACPPVRDLIGAADQDLAYRVQAEVTERRVSEGGRVIGRKIGLTSRAVQAQLGVPSPDFGTLFDDMAYVDREPIDLGRFLQPRIEAEIAFVLGADLRQDVVHAGDVIAATDVVLPALEIVDSRIRNWDIAIADTIADNASSGSFVLGTTPRRLVDVDLPDVGMALESAGDVVSSGAGVACMGSPVAAVTWLARTLAQRGAPLRAGDVILSGALGPVVSVTAPGSYRARFSGMGQVTAVFERGAHR